MDFLTVVMLQDICGGLGVKKNGSKEELINRITSLNKPLNEILSLIEEDKVRKKLKITTEMSKDDLIKELKKHIPENNSVKIDTKIEQKKPVVPESMIPKTKPIKKESSLIESIMETIFVSKPQEPKKEPPKRINIPPKLRSTIWDVWIGSNQRKVWCPLCMNQEIELTTPSAPFLNCA